MLIVKVSHESDGGLYSSHALPITISESEIEVLKSDYCEVIIQPPITANDLALLRRHCVEFEWDELIFGLDEEVLV